MEVETNDLGFSKSFQSKFPPKIYTPEAIRFHEYVNHEVSLATQEGNFDVVETLLRVMNFAKGSGLKTIYKEIPVKSQSVAKALRGLTETDRDRVRQLIDTLSRKSKT